MPFCGLQNIGNTCYFNTTLQCLARCPGLLKILERNMQKGIRLKGGGERCLQVLLEYKNLLKAMEKCTILSPDRLISRVQQYASTRRGSQFKSMRIQHDMSESLLFLLQILHLSISYKASITIKGNPKTFQDEQIFESMTHFKNNFKDEYSEIIPSFYGQFQTCCHRLNKNSFSYAYDPFATIQLDIPCDKKNVNLYDCFNAFCSLDVIETEDEIIHKRMKFWSFPEYLIIVLKRFTAGCRKRHDNVRIPFDIDLRNYCVGPNKSSCQFTLIATGNHKGGTRGGHYYAQIKDYQSDKWFTCNDNSVNRTSKAAISSPFAYCLIYEKKEK